MPITLVSALPGEQHFASERHRTQLVTCVDDFDYWTALAAHWCGGDTIINVEHDMEVSDGLIDGLLECPHPLCAYAYKVWPSAWKRFVYAQSKDGHWLEEGQTEADFSSIGLCKIGPSARTGELQRAPWKFLEQTVNWAVTGPWHIHWPEVAHYHDYKEPDTPWQSLLNSLALEPGAPSS